MPQPQRMKEVFWTTLYIKFFPEINSGRLTKEDIDRVMTHIEIQQIYLPDEWQRQFEVASQKLQQLIAN